jgi:hypothetical protein
LPESYTLEDLLPADVYASALREVGDLSVAELSAGELSHPYRTAAKAKFEALGRTMRGPIALAEHILIVFEEPLATSLFSEAEQRVLIDLHDRLVAALQPTGKHGLTR